MDELPEELLHIVSNGLSDIRDNVSFQRVNRLCHHVCPNPCEHILNRIIELVDTIDVRIRQSTGILCTGSLALVPRANNKPALVIHRDKQPQYVSLHYAPHIYDVLQRDHGMLRKRLQQILWPKVKNSRTEHMRKFIVAVSVYDMDVVTLPSFSTYESNWRKGQKWVQWENESSWYRTRV